MIINLAHHFCFSKRTMMFRKNHIMMKSSIWATLNLAALSLSHCSGESRSVQKQFFVLRNLSLFLDRILLQMYAVFFKLRERKQWRRKQWIFDILKCKSHAKVRFWEQHAPASVKRVQSCILGYCDSCERKKMSQFVAQGSPSM